MRVLLTVVLCLLLVTPAWAAGPYDGIWSVREVAPDGRADEYLLSITSNDAYLPLCDCNAVSLMYLRPWLGVGLILGDTWQNNLHEGDVLVGRMFLRFFPIPRPRFLGSVQYEDGTYADLTIYRVFE
jgi:hypothetical protein